MLPCIQIEPKSPANAAIIWLHGLGANGRDFESIVPELTLPTAAHIRFIFPNAPNISVTLNGGMSMPAWYDIITLSNTGRDINEQQLLHSANEIKAIIQELIEAGIDSQRVILAGFSQGGAVAIHAGLTCELPLAGILALSTYFPTSESITGHSVNDSLPIMVMHGQQDHVVPLPLAEHMLSVLKEKNYTPTFKTYSMEHSICVPQIQDISTWISSVLTTDK